MQKLELAALFLMRPQEEAPAFSCSYPLQHKETLTTAQASLPAPSRASTVHVACLLCEPAAVLQILSLCTLERPSHD